MNLIDCQSYYLVHRHPMWVVMIIRCCNNMLDEFLESWKGLDAPGVFVKQNRRPKSNQVFPGPGKYLRHMIFGLGSAPIQNSISKGRNESIKGMPDHCEAEVISWA